MSTIYNSRIMMRLPDGRKVDVCTKNGANAFIQSSPEPFNFFTTTIDAANRIRQKAKEKNNRGSGKSKLTAQQKRRLEVIYMTADALTVYSDQTIFDMITELEFECWMDHVMVQIVELTKDKQWIQTGQLSEQYDTIVLNSCVSMFGQSVSTRLAFDKGFYHVLGDFVASRKAPLLPCTDVAETIVLIVCNIVRSFVGHSREKITMTIERALKNLESSGMLAQFIRCSTIPDDIGNIAVLTVYDALIKCPALVKKKLKIGSPCGEIVSNILNGTDYSTKNVELIKKLKMISSYADLAQINVNAPRADDYFLKNGLRFCRYCDKTGYSKEFQMSLKLCGKCKNTYYCSRECQLADWKIHKTTCSPNSRSQKKNSDSNEIAIGNFSQKNYAKIMQTFVKISDKTGLNKSELVLEIDFLSNDSNNGTAPALQNPPQFKVASTRGYLEESRPNEPDWFYKTCSKTKQERDLYQQNVGQIVKSLKDMYNRMTKNHILCLVRFPDGITPVRLQCAEPDNGNEIFSDKAMNAIRSAINDDDFGPLIQIYGKDSERMRHLEWALKLPNL